MTLKQLKRTQQSYLAEFDRAVVRRRKALVKFFKHQITERKKLANPNNASTSHAVKMKMKMHNMIYRSVMNNAGNPKCARWKRTSKGKWYTTSKRRCMA